MLLRWNQIWVKGAGDNAGPGLWGEWYSVEDEKWKTKNGLAAYTELLLELKHTVCSVYRLHLLQETQNKDYEDGPDYSLCTIETDAKQ